MFCNSNVLRQGRGCNSWRPALHTHTPPLPCPRLPQTRYGVPAPSTAPLGALRGPANRQDRHVVGTMPKGLPQRTSPAVIIPRKIMDDPYAVPPPEVADMELTKARASVLP